MLYTLQQKHGAAAAAVYAITRQQRKNERKNAADSSVHKTDFLFFCFAFFFLSFILFAALFFPMTPCGSVFLVTMRANPRTACVTSVSPTDLRKKTRARGVHDNSPCYKIYRIVRARRRSTIATRAYRPTQPRDFALQRWPTRLFSADVSPSTSAPDQRKSRVARRGRTVAAVRLQTMIFGDINDDDDVTDRRLFTVRRRSLMINGGFILLSTYYAY